MNRIFFVCESLSDNSLVQQNFKKSALVRQLTYPTNHLSDIITCPTTQLSDNPLVRKKRKMHLSDNSLVRHSCKNSSLF